MKIALTGATGFIGKYIVEHLVGQGYQLNCWYRESSNRERLEPFAGNINWVPGQLQDLATADDLLAGCDAVVHNAFWRPGVGFRGAEGDLVEFARVNILGTLNLIEKSITAGIGRFIFVSTCAVHEQILDDRPLDEAHPLWPLSHYGAHKAALEKFVHSFGLGQDYPICAIRPTGVYGIREPLADSKWYSLIARIVAGEDVQVTGGGKEVHAGDVAKGIGVLLQADSNKIRGESFACYDRYISQHEVAVIAKEIAGSSSAIVGEPKTPKHQIATDKIRALGMKFGGQEQLRNTIENIISRR